MIMGTSAREQAARERERRLAVSREAIETINRWYLKRFINSEPGQKSNLGLMFRRHSDPATIQDSWPPSIIRRIGRILGL